MLSECDVVIEAVFEDMQLKKEIFKKLDKVCGPDCLLCTNTSFLDIDEIAEVTSRPQKVMGTHFFSPAHIMRLLENVKGKHTDKDTIATCMEFGKRIGKVPVLVGNCDGFVGNRMVSQYGAEASRMLYEGNTPSNVDNVIFRFGMPMGPLTMTDMAGLEIGHKTRKNIYSSGDKQAIAKVEAYGPYVVRDHLVENNHYGQKTGRGQQMYEKGRKKGDDPEVIEMHKEAALKKNILQISQDDKEVEERIMMALMNEGFKVLEEGIAMKPSDIDVIQVFGFGFPKP